ncbi:MAG: class I SAM-dependent methyltransferase, partial [Planktomarina sp.]
VVDGQKTDGIDSYYKGIRKLTDVAGTITKGHGRLFWFNAIDLVNWDDTPADVDGFQTRAGVFSADGIDPASAMLAAHLPETMKGSVLDLGAGWGFLAKHVLGREVSSVDLVEADHVALECAKVNVTDARAKFYWANAIKHKGKYDWVIMNPPFHKGREGDPGLGQAFIQTAAKCLAPGGKLLMVANAHLPYEATMEACFIKVETIKPDRRFKIFQASRPKR